MGILDVIGIYCEYPLLTDAFSLAMTSLLSCFNGDRLVLLPAGLEIKAKYMPWILLGLNAYLVGTGWELPLIGIIVGHFAYYIDSDYSIGNIIILPLAVAVIVPWFLLLILLMLLFLL